MTHRRHRKKTQDGGGTVQLPPLFYSQDRKKKYVLKQAIGEGAFCVCHLFELPATHDQPAVSLAGKVFSRGKGSSRKRLERFEREVTIMKSLTHPNIVRYIDSISGVHGGKTLVDFKKNDSVPFTSPPVMFIEYCSGGSLSSFMKSRRPHKKQHYGRLTEKETLWVAECAARALDYLRGKRIIHRDIKLGNMLLQSPAGGELAVGIVLCDFGLSTLVPEGMEFVPHVVGTRAYIAPELIEGEGACYASDVWSLGVTMFHCLTARAPFEGNNSEETERKICVRSFRWRSSEQKFLSPAVRLLVNQMLQLDPTKRPLPSEIVTRVTAMAQEVK